MIRIVQLNLQKSLAATTNLINFDFDVALVQEPNIRAFNSLGLRAFYVGNARTAILCKKEVNFSFSAEFSDKDITTGLIQFGSKKAYISSIYLEQLPGSRPWSEVTKAIYYPKWMELIEHCRRVKVPYIAGLDCNAHSVQWGCAEENLRGKALEELLTNHGMIIHNSGSTPTYERINANSIIDITVSKGDLEIVNWEVSKAATFSDHKALTYCLQGQFKRSLQAGINYMHMDWAAFRSQMLMETRGQSEQLWNPELIETKLKEVYDAINASAEKAAPPRGSKKRPYKIWWDEECENSRMKTNIAQKRWWKSHLIEDFEQYKAEKFRHKKSIYKAKKKAWRELVSGADSMKKISDLNRILSGKTRKSFGMFKMPDGKVCTDQKENLAFLLKSHFKGRVKEAVRITPDKEMIKIHRNEYYTLAAFKRAVGLFRPHAAPGPDGIKPIILQNLPDEVIQLICDIFTASLALGYVPFEWTKSQVVFACKGDDRDMNDPRTFRPISLTSFLFKTQERLNMWWCEDEGLDLAMHNQQFAFRKGQSTEKALSEMVTLMEKGTECKQFVLLLFLDIRGAFDNIKTSAISDAMVEAKIPEAIRKWYNYYLRNRYSTAEQNDAKVTMQIDDGVPQGGVMSPPIGWNLAFNKFLALYDKGPVKVKGFADDAGLAIIGIDPKVMSSIMQEALNKASKWADENGLEICPKKTAVMLCTGGKRKYAKPKDILLKGQRINYVDHFKYLGVQISNNLSWKVHIEEKCKKAKKALAILSATMGKLWGPNPRWTRYAYMGIIRPSITYGSVVWAKATDQTGVKKKLDSVQRLGLLSIAPVRRSTPTQALEIIYDIKPLDLHVKEMAMKANIRLNLPTFYGHGRYNAAMIPNDIKAAKVDTIPTTRLSWTPMWESRILQGEPVSRTITCFSDGSLKEDKSGAGGVILHRGKELISFSTPYKGATVYQAELLGIKQAADYLFATQVCDEAVAFNIDNQSTIKALMGSETKLHTVKETWDSLVRLVGNNNSLILNWVKAHIGTRYNEYADNAAKRATERKPFIDAPMSQSTINNLIEKELSNRWLKKWEAYGEARQAKHFIAGPNGPRARVLLSYNKDMVGNYVRFITGHAHMKRHNKVLELGTRMFQDDVSCSLCKDGDETPIHLLFNCPSLNSVRNETLGTFDLSNHETFYDYSIGEMMRFISDKRIRNLENPLLE